MNRWAQAAIIVLLAVIAANLTFNHQATPVGNVGVSIEPGDGCPPDWEYYASCGYTLP